MILIHYFQVKIIKHLLEHKKAIQATTITWTVFVAYFCLTNSENLPQVEVLKFDGLGHFVFHFGITFLWFLFWKTTFNTENKFALLKGFLFSVFFGIIIELFQFYFIETRQGDLKDILANCYGALSAILVVKIFLFFRNKNNPS